MKYELQFTQKAKNNLIVLDKIIQQRIVKKLKFYISQAKPLSYAKKLKNNRLGEYRFRMGDYRIIFDINKNGRIIVLIILNIKHRREVYL